MTLTKFMVKEPKSDNVVGSGARNNNSENDFFFALFFKQSFA